MLTNWRESVKIKERGEYFLFEDGILKEVVFLKFKQTYGSYHHVASTGTQEIYKNTKGETVLTLATDKLPTHEPKADIIIPDKGRLFTAISAKMSTVAEHKWNVWTSYLCSNVYNQELVNPWSKIDDFIPDHDKIFGPELLGRATISEEIQMFPFDYIVYGHMRGHIWQLYQNGQREIREVSLPDGMEYGDRLPKPILTPTVVAPSTQYGQPITNEDVAEITGSKGMALDIRWHCRNFFEEAYRFLSDRGIILADTKFRLGSGKYSDYRYIIFGGEVLTPDCSHYWDAERRYDGQDIIKYLIDKSSAEGTPAVVPEELIDQTRQNYIELYRRITGNSWSK